MLSKYLKGILRFPADSDGSTGGASDAQENQTDVKPEGDSSASEQQQTDGAKPTLESVIQDTFKASQATSEEKADESSIRKSNETQEKETEKGKGEDGEPKPDDKKEVEKKEEIVEEGKPVPYERFAEVNTKAKTLEEQIQVVEPLARAQQTVIDHCQNNGISAEEFANWMDIAALAKTDPIAAMEKLNPIVEGLKGYTGDKLSSDLQSAVDNGDISLEYAKRLHKAEMQSKFGEQKVQRMQQGTVEQQQHQFMQTMQSSVSKWIDSKKASDPDFAPKKSANSPHGKFELFMNEFAAQAKANAGKIKGPQDLIALAEQSFALIESTLKGFQPKVQPTKRVSSTNSSSSTNGAPKTVQEAMAVAAAKHGITLPK